MDRSIVSSIDRSIDRSKEFQQNSQNYLIPDKTAKSDILSYNVRYRNRYDIDADLFSASLSLHLCTEKDRNRC